jgi:hypothetical protein
MAYVGGVEMGIVRREGTNTPADQECTARPWKSHSTMLDPSKYQLSLPQVQGCLQ